MSACILKDDTAWSLYLWIAKIASRGEGSATDEEGKAVRLGGIRTSSKDARVSAVFLLK